MKQRIKQLEQKAREIRKYTLRCIGTLGMGHIGGCLSIADLLAVLYFDQMNVNPEDKTMRGRDRLVVSKGHAGPAVYSALALKGYFPEAMLETLNKPHTNLPSHCDMSRTPGIDMTTGSLGQGLSVAVGMAIAAKLDRLPSRIFVILGDGCNQEGQTWEAAMYASHRGLDNIIAFTDKNNLQIDNAVDEVNTLGDLKAKWEAFGWNAISLQDGNDVSQILDAITLAQAKTGSGKPTMIILETVKGKGVYFAEGRIDSHHRTVSEEEWKKAAAELEGR